MNLKEQVKSLHFWLGLLVAAISGVLAKGMIPDGAVHSVLESTLMLLGPFVALKGGAWQPPAKPALPPPLEDVTPTSPGKLMMLLPLVLALHGCAAGRDYAIRYGECMESKGLQVVASIPSQVTNILNSASVVDTAQVQLEALAGQGAVDAVICAVQAWVADSVNKARAGAGMLAARAFLAAHGVK